MSSNVGQASRGRYLSSNTRLMDGFSSQVKRAWITRAGATRRVRNVPKAGGSGLRAEGPLK